MQAIGHYTPRRLLGEGATGRVYEAEEAGSDRVVALKVLPPALARESVRERLVAELAALTRLDHPNAARCFSCREIGEKVVLAFELLSGQTLRARLHHTGRVHWREVVELGVQIASALGAAHELRPPIIHCDLKPENVMIVGEAGVKVTDFAVARAIGSAGQLTTAAFGSAKYMSPEQIDAWTVDARADVYTLGLVLYEMLTGDVPFTDSSPRELLTAQCTQPPPPFSSALRAEIPERLEALVRRLLEKQPDARPANGREVAGLLQAIRADHQVAAAAGVAPAELALPHHAPASAPRKSSHTPALVGLLAVVALLCGVAGYFIYRQGGLQVAAATVVAAFDQSAQTAVADPPNGTEEPPGPQTPSPSAEPSTPAAPGPQPAAVVSTDENAASEADAIEAQGSQSPSAEPESSSGPTGVPACDEYLRKYSKCIDEQLPKASRAAAKQAIERAAEGWKNIPQAARASLADACRAAMEAVSEQCGF